ncbi:pentapeptide repeat-containing protein [Paenibacillus maysiensis]|uniref:pentapeptide repeat-containing protein n=1 Tax=Paenibacillus maysiensis TaxID=1155954 RepID=UPI00047092C3|nr:pentapeptide repeat-containing protein [Paenibacillus maysiensis]
MDKQAALKQIYEHDFVPLLEENLQALEAEFQRNKTILTVDLVSAFREMCQLIKNMQDRNEKAPIGYIHFSMLRTSILDQTYLYVIEAYSDEWYFDQVNCTVTYDASWAFRSIASIIDVLDQKRKPYIRLLNRADVERMVWSSSHYFHQFIATLLRLAVHQMIEMPEYQSIQKAKCLFIRIGEFKDQSEQVYIEDLVPLHENDLKQRLLDEGETEHPFENVKGATLRDLRMVEKDLRYSDFGMGDFSNSQFRNCVLLGTTWRNANLRDVDFSGSILSDADFSGSDLRGVHFYAVKGNVFREGSYRTGLLGIRFTNANLDGVNLVGAHFGEQVDFKGASMQGTMLSKSNQEHFRLSPSQLQMVQWVD